MRREKSRSRASSKNPMERATPSLSTATATRSSDSCASHSTLRPLRFNLSQSTPARALTPPCRRPRASSTRLPSTSPAILFRPQALRSRPRVLLLVERRLQLLKARRLLVSVRKSRQLRVLVKRAEESDRYRRPRAANVVVVAVVDRRGRGRVSTAQAV